MIELASPEFFTLRGYLLALGNCLAAYNYETFFEVKGYDYANSQFDRSFVLKTAYPESAVELGRFYEVSPTEFVERLADCLKTPKATGDYYDESVLKTIRAVEEYREWIQTDLARDFWQLFGACIDHNHADILGYEPPADTSVFDELRCGVYWCFTYLVHNRQQRRCLILHGGASD